MLHYSSKDCCEYLTVVDTDKAYHFVSGSNSVETLDKEGLKEKFDAQEWEPISGGTVPGAFQSFLWADEYQHCKRIQRSVNHV